MAHVLGYQMFDQCIVPCESGAHRDWVSVPSAGAALDVGEQKRNRACGEPT
jgi:hypothetical protein